MRLQPSSKQHEALFQELTGVLRKYDLSAVEILAVVSNLTGKVLAMQDQTKGDAAHYMAIVSSNLEEGNRQVVAELMSTRGRA